MPLNRAILFRRISALFIFFIVLAVFILLFYYKYVPNNREELNQRSHRVLTQLTQNFLRKDQDLHNIIEDAGAEYANMVNKKSPYDRLYANMHYDTSTKTAANVPHLQTTDTGVWIIQHHSTAVKDTNLAKVYLTVKVRDFADPIFSTRADIFQNYLILYDSTASLPENSPNSNKLSLVYQQHVVSAAADVNTDTLKSLAKNSDESGVFYLSLSGEKYVAFFARFAFHQQPLILVGLIPKDTYDRKVEATPIYFLPLIIISISLIMIALPYLKVFLLSAMEPINSYDVLKTALSFYAGSVALTMIIFYFFLNYVTDRSLQSRLRHFSTKVQDDVEREIRQANQQLTGYDFSIGDQPPNSPIKKILGANRTTPNPDENIVDFDCTPGSYLALTRLMWVDSAGNTIGKWSPFKYATPFTTLNNYPFFQILANKPAWFNGVAGYDQPVLYPGKSNLTDEFQTFIARQSHKSTWRDTTVIKQDSFRTSFYIVIAATLHSTIQPVMPKGFGFCLIDNNGKVLIDGDNHRSLGENLFLESDNNKELLDAVHYNNSEITFPLELYGDPYIARVTPITGQPLHLVCFYNQKIFIGNIDRFFHFSIHTLVLIWILLIGCLLVSTFGQWRPVLLNFNPAKEEWIRPSSTDKKLLAYIFRYFSKLLFLSLVFFLVIAIFSATLIPLFYTSLLLPFYALAGVQNAHQWKGRIYTGIAVVILNILIIVLIIGSGKDYSLAIAPLLFQLCAVLMPWPSLSWQSWRPDKMYRMYLYALYLSIALIGILPTLGILSYGFYAEKIQYKKYKLAHAATDFFQRDNYLLTNLLPSYKPKVLANLGTDFQKRLLFLNSIYLTDNDTIEKVNASDSLPPPKHDLPDGLYALLMDKGYLAPQLWQDDLSVPDASPDGEWIYQIMADSQVQYSSTRPVGNADIGIYNIRIRSHLQKPLADLKGIWLVALCSGLLLIALLVLAGQLIAGAINRLFLMDVIDHMKEIAVDKNYLEKFFVPAELVGPPSYLKILSFQIIPFNMDFLKYEKGFDAWPPTLPKPECDQAEFILALTDLLAPIYKKIWNSLLPEEQYILHDFSNDRYTNYKNSTILYKLIGKGILVTCNDVPDVFSMSFRQYVLSPAIAADVIKLKLQFSLPGTWQTIRIPVISILVVMGIFLFRTQPEIATFIAGLAAFFGSISTIINLLPKANSNS